MLTPEQINAIRAKSGLAPLQAQNTTNQPPAQQGNFVGKYDHLKTSSEPKKDEKGVGRKVFDFFTESAQKFGDTLGKAASVVDPTTNNTRNDMMKQNDEAVNHYIDLAKNSKSKESAKKFLEAAAKIADTSEIDIFNNKEYQKTAKQVFGEAAGTALETLSWGSYGEASKAIPSIAKPILSPAKTIIEGAKSGAKAGLSYGAISSGAKAMQDNKSVVDIAKDTLAGGATGAVGGAVIGSAASGAYQLAKGAINQGKKVVDATGKMVNSVGSKIKKSAQDIADSELITPINEGLKNELTKQSTNTKLMEYVNKTKEAAADYSKPTALELAGEKAQTALKKLQNLMGVHGSAKEAIVKENANLHTGDIVDSAISNLNSLLNDRVGGKITKVSKKTANGVKVKFVLSQSNGRLLKIADQSDANLLLKVHRKLQEVSKNPTFQKVDDAVGYIQESLYKAKGNLNVPVNSQVEGVLKQITKHLNEGLKEKGGEAYKASKGMYSVHKKAFEKLNKMLGADNSKGGSLMKRVFSPADGGTKKLFEEVKRLTGVDLVEEATLAKFAMEQAGDPRSANLLEQLDLMIPKGNLGYFQKVAEKVIEKSKDPIRKATNIIQKKAQ
jgi:hypothetical protein